jgi:hypothetical protein
MSACRGGRAELQHKAVVLLRPAIDRREERLCSRQMLGALGCRKDRQVAGEWIPPAGSGTRVCAQVHSAASKARGVVVSCERTLFVMASACEFKYA